MVTAILAAAGRGRRFGAPESKVFAHLAGTSVLRRSLLMLEACPSVDAAVVVCGSADLDRAQAEAAGCSRVVAICAGGEERHHSVVNALAAVPSRTEWVAVHDAARPLCSTALFEAVIAAARGTGAALPALPITDTLKYSADGRTALQTVPRAGLYSVQTPQVFRCDLLREAYSSAPPGFAGTDDASYVERLGHPVALVPGELSNLKITVAEDLSLAETLLHRQQRAPIPAIRTGFGYDVHRLAPGLPLVLGGVPLIHPGGLGLEGHSDADVLLHAIADALLGAAALGDIGRHFPNTDPAYRGISSLVLLERAMSAVRAAGWEVGNVDATLLAEQPRIAPHVEEMRSRIASALRTTTERVSVKATTNERLGFSGREEGIAAHAVATLVAAAVP